MRRYPAKAMPVTKQVKAHDAAVRAERADWVQRVLSQPAFNPPLNMRLLAFFDDEDAECFRGKYGPENRGLFFRTVDAGGTPWSRSGLERDECPKYLLDLLFPPETCPSLNSSDREISSFDGLIYLYGSTCINPTALVMTFAHELQHSYQLERTPHLWCDNERLKGRRVLKPYEIPTEREAKAVAKHIAEELCGTDVVREYIRERINDGRQKIAIYEDEIRDWRWIQEWNSKNRYCLQSETKMAVDKMNSERKSD
jgi:hypothetical protein